MRTLVILPLAVALGCSADPEPPVATPPAPTPDPDLSLQIEIGEDGGSIRARGDDGRTAVEVDPHHTKVEVEKKKGG